MLRLQLKCVRECEAAESDQVLDANTKHMCNIHGHLLLMLRNAKAADLTKGRVATIVCAMVFLSYADLGPRTAV